MKTENYRVFEDRYKNFNKTLANQIQHHLKKDFTS